MTVAASERLEALLAEMRGCPHCDLSVGRTQVVPGEGPADTRVMLVGHGPGGTDDATGRPYTGPGGDALDELLAQAGIRREQIYITNLTKCWAWKEEYGRRVNRTPAVKEVKACVPLWLKQELEIIRPAAIVCLGGPTAQHFLGRDFKITQRRGEWLEMPPDSPHAKMTGQHGKDAPLVMAIVQPAYLIHLAEHAPESYPGARAGMLRDLAKVKAVLEGTQPTAASAQAEAVEEDIPF
jgi:uracil-DNA glycosylase family 4